VNQPQERSDYSSLNDRMSYLFAIRIAVAVVTLVYGIARPEALGVPFSTVVTVALAYVATSVVFEAVRRRTTRFGYSLITVMLLIDGAFLAAAMYVTGGTQSPFRFFIYLHLVAVSLLASYRTGLKIALWHSLLLFVVLYAQAAHLLPPVDVVPGREIEFERMPILSVTSFWLFALATSVFSAINERELRQRRADLQAMVDIGARLDEARDPVVQSRIVLDGLIERFGFVRGLILGASDGQVLVLAAHGIGALPTTRLDTDAIVNRAWEQRRPLPVRRLDATSNPFLAAALPNANNVLVSPMIADGRSVGAIILEYGRRRTLGIERRVVSVVGQLASTAALNLRNAVLLRHVQDLAERDSLTGAANRRMFQLSLERILDPDAAAPHLANTVSAVLFIDLDDFKVVNDTLGHAVGDALLVAVTERIASLVREQDLVARLGGDEFAVLTTDQPDLARARAMADRLVGELRKPYLIDGKPVHISASIGIASARDAVDGARDLVRNADVAMYMAKANGKSNFAVFDPGMHAAIRDRHELATELQVAVELDQLRLVYQPIVELDTRRMAGAEALVRWEHPQRGLMAPDSFIPLAEETGLVVPLGLWVLDRACRQAAEWARLDPDVTVSVNVSQRQLRRPDFERDVDRVLRDSGVDPGRVNLEITESAVMSDVESTIQRLQELKALGVRIAVDDFGTGYSSFSWLRQLPVDVLKIDKEFVGELGHREQSGFLVATIIDLAHNLGLRTVAEGIERTAQLDRLRDMHCDLGQGFHVGRPMVAADVVDLLAVEDGRHRSTQSA